MASIVSSISQALSNNLDSISIPKPGAVRGDWSHNKFSAGSVPGITRVSGLPTPPNSLSPGLPAHGLSERARKEAPGSPPIQVDSDIDLQDAVDHANSQGNGLSMTATEQGGSEGHGDITPAFLAKHHLPGIVLDQGPIAIRHVMNQLGRSVPGFSEIPPAKARRIVVGALESRIGGGLQGDVQFEKVGWGRWDAKVRNHAQKDVITMQTIQEGFGLTPSALKPLQLPTAAVQIPGRSVQHHNSRSLSHGSWTGDSISSSRSEQGDRMDLNAGDHDMDAMEIDDDRQAFYKYPASSNACDRHSHYQYPGPNPASLTILPALYSDTDEEDWSVMGAAALRANSYSSEGTGPKLLANKRSRTRSPCHTLPQSLPAQIRLRHRRRHHRRHHGHCNDALPRKPNHTPVDFSALPFDPQEREAIQALFLMGSM